jgi:hypothetical protein
VKLLKPFLFEVTLGSITAVEKVGFSNVKRASLHQYGILVVCKVFFSDNILNAKI